MIKEIPDAAQMRMNQLKSIDEWNEKILHNLINGVNQALVEAAENGCNQINVSIKHISDNTQRDEFFRNYYEGKGYKIKLHDDPEILIISFRQDDDPEKTWLGSFEGSREPYTKAANAIRK